MDNSRRYRRPKTGKRPASVDGFIKPNNAQSQENNPFARHRNRSVRAQVDDFKRADGFHPTGRTNTGTRDTGGFGRQPVRDKTGQIDIERVKTQQPKAKRRLNLPGGRRLAIKAMSMLFIIGIVSAGYLFGKALLNAQQTFGGGAAAIEETINRDGRINILMLGRGGEGHTAPDLTDTLVLASIDPVNNEAALVSIPRDLYVSSGPYGGYTKINAVFANAKNVALAEGSNPERAQEAGLQAIQKEVSEFTGVPVHYYVMVDFKGFEEAINVVGGVDANVPENLSVYEIMSINGRAYELNAPAGQQHFDGFRALAFSRTRMTSARGDFDRSERQRLMMLALKDKVLSAGTFANPVKVTQLINTLGDHVRTNLSGLDELTKLYDIGTKIQGDKVKSIGLADPPKPLLQTANIGGLSVVIPVAGLDDYSQVQEYLGFELRDGFLKQEDAEVAVLNGAGIPGLATETAAKLKKSGYRIVKVADAGLAAVQARTVIVHTGQEQKPKTREYLEKYFSVTVTDKLPAGLDPGTADLVIILGTDETSDR